MNGHAWSELGAASMYPFGKLLIARYAPFGSYIVATETTPTAKLRMSKARSNRDASQEARYNYVHLIVKTNIKYTGKKLH